MSDYHILGGDKDGNGYTVVIHIPIPSANNRIGVNYRTALVAMLGGSQPSAVPGLAAAEQTQLDNGEVYEEVHPVATRPGETAIQYRDRVDALYAARVAEAQAELQNRLAYWGYTRDVP